MHDISIRGISSRNSFSAIGFKMSLSRRALVYCADMKTYQMRTSPAKSPSPVYVHGPLINVN